jgi:hypothetical protein
MADGEGCKCNAHCEHECACDADWTTKEVYDLRAELAQRTADLAKANAERDEARREACRRELHVRMGNYTAKEIAAERGWDCFDAKEGKP